MRKKTGYIQNRGTSWRIAYYDANSIRQFESFTTEDEAVRELARRIADVANGVPVSSKPNTVLFGELAVDVMNDYKVNKRRSYDDIEARFRIHIDPFFGKRKASQITTAQINAYILQRQSETPTPSNGTINRELQAIRHTFYLARDGGKLYRVPKVPMLKESNPRSGFFTREEVERLCSHLKAPLDSFVMFAFLTGWRYEEIRTLQWRNVDFGAGEIRLDPGTTKSGDGRVIKMTADLRTLLLHVKDATTTGDKAIVPSAAVRRPIVSTSLAIYVFAINGKPIGQFRKTWKTANHKAGLPCTVDTKGKVVKAIRLFHDLRRSAARELSNQGISERVIRQMMGHKTASMFTRYAIVSDVDLAEAAAKIDAKRATNGAKEGYGIRGS